MLQIHQLIELERDKAGYTQEEMAEKLGIKRSTYQYWEEKTPSVDKIRLVCKALLLPEDYFFVKIAEQKDASLNKLEESSRAVIKSLENSISIRDKLISVQTEMIKKLENEVATDKDNQLSEIKESLNKLHSSVDQLLRIQKALIPGLDPASALGNKEVLKDKRKGK